MKKTILSLAIAAITITSYKASAQVSVQVNIGGVFSAAINTAPVIAANPADYYYYDDINCYYDVNQGMYIYPYDNAWYYSNTVPTIFSNYNFHNARYSRLNRAQFQSRNIRYTAMPTVRPEINRRDNMALGRNNPVFNQQNNRGFNQRDNRSVARMDNRPNNNMRNTDRRQGNRF